MLQDLILGALLLATLAWILHPVVDFATLYSGDPFRERSLKPYLTIQATLLSTAALGTIAYRLKSEYASTILMMYLGALFRCALLDEENITRAPSEPFISYALRYLKSQLATIFKTKAAAAVAAVSAPILISTPWVHIGMASALGFLPNKGYRVFCNIRETLPPKERLAAEKEWAGRMNELMTRLSIAAAVPAMAIYSLNPIPSGWSAFAGFTLLSGILALVLLFAGNQSAA